MAQYACGSADTNIVPRVAWLALIVLIPACGRLGYAPIVTGDAPDVGGRLRLGDSDVASAGTDAVPPRGSAASDPAELRMDSAVAFDLLGVDATPAANGLDAAAMMPDTAVVLDAPATMPDKPAVLDATAMMPDTAVVLDAPATMPDTAVVLDAAAMMPDTPVVLDAALAIDAVTSSAPRFRMGKLTKPTAPGSITVTHGLGVTPTAILFLGNWCYDTDDFAGNQLALLGVATATETMFAATGAAQGIRSNTSAEVSATHAVGAVAWSETYIARANVVGWDAQTFTLAFDAADNEVDTIFFLAVGGPDISAKAVSWSMPAVTGDRPVRGFGFPPDMVMHFWAHDRVTSAGALVPGGGIGLGVSNRAGAQWALATWQADDARPTEEARIQDTSASILTLSRSAVLKRASFASTDADGFTLRFEQAAGAPGTRVISLGLRGITAELGAFVKTTSASLNATQTVNGLKRTTVPGAVMLASTMGFGPTGSPMPHARWGMGLATPDTGAQATFTTSGEDGAAGSLVNEYQHRTRAFAVVDSATHTLDALARLVQVRPSGFDLVWEKNDTAPTQIFYLTLGSP